MGRGAAREVLITETLQILADARLELFDARQVFSVMGDAATTRRARRSLSATDQLLRLVEDKLANVG